MTQKKAFKGRNLIFINWMLCLFYLFNGFTSMWGYTKWKILCIPQRRKQYTSLIIVLVINFFFYKFYQYFKTSAFLQVYWCSRIWFVFHPGKWIECELDLFMTLYCLVVHKPLNHVYCMIYWSAILIQLKCSFIECAVID